MGVLGKTLQAASGDGQMFVDGYTPDRCWFRNGYVTSAMMGKVKEAIVGSDEMSDEDIILIIWHANLYDQSLTSEQIAPILRDLLQNEVGSWVGNRGVALSYSQEEFIMRMLGWRDYCILAGAVSKGKNPYIGVKERHGAYGYYVVANQEEV